MALEEHRGVAEARIDRHDDRLGGHDVAHEPGGVRAHDVHAPAPPRVSARRLPARAHGPAGLPRCRGTSDTCVRRASSAAMAAWKLAMLSRTERDSGRP